MLRYTRLTDAQVLDRLLRVCEAESVSYDDKGLEAILFTAEGDMRQVCLVNWTNFEPGVVSNSNKQYKILIR